MIVDDLEIVEVAAHFLGRGHQPIEIKVAALWEGLWYHRHLNISGNTQFTLDAFLGGGGLLELAVGILQLVVSLLQSACCQLATVEVETEEGDDEQGDGPCSGHQDMLGMLPLLLGLHFRLVFAELQILVVGFKAVVLQLHGGVGQFCVAILKREHQGLFLQLFVLQLFSRHIEPHLLVTQLQLLGFEFHAP